MRLEVVVVDASPYIELPRLSEASSRLPPDTAQVARKKIVIDGQELEAALWDREKLVLAGIRVSGPCIITEMAAMPLFFQVLMQRSTGLATS